MRLVAALLRCILRLTLTLLRLPLPQRIEAALRRGRRRSSVERETIAEARRGLEMLLRAAAKFRTLLKRVRARAAADGGLQRRKPLKPPVVEAPAAAAAGKATKKKGGAGATDAHGRPRRPGRTGALSPLTTAEATRPDGGWRPAAGGHAPQPRGVTVPGTVRAPPRSLLQPLGGGGGGGGGRPRGAVAAAPAAYAALTEARRDARAPAGGRVRPATSGGSGFRSIYSLAAASGLEPSVVLQQAWSRAE